jgi:hypothetical protein
MAREYAAWRRARKREGHQRPRASTIDRTRAATSAIRAS